MGIVYEAEQESLGRRVAVKVLPRHSLLTPESLKRFQREARIAAGLSHPNIVSVFGVGEHDGLHYYVMQFIQGVGLDRVISQLREPGRQTIASQETPPGTAATTSVHSPRELEKITQLFRPAEARGQAGRRNGGQRAAGEIPGWMNNQYWGSVARIVQQAARAIHYAHTRGTLHCDIKPANLLVDAEGAVWVTDFGVAKALQFEKLTASGEVTGTLQYTAPERFQGQTEIRSDVYSLGLTLYELLTLRSPFEGDRQKMLRRIIDGAAPAPRQLNPAVPRDLETIVLKAIARDPNARYLTAGAMADDLGRYLASLPVEARRVGTVQRAWSYCRRNRPIAGLSLAVAALLIAIVVLAIGALSRDASRGKANPTATTPVSTPGTIPPAGSGSAGQPAGVRPGDVRQPPSLPREDHGPRDRGPRPPPDWQGGAKPPGHGNDWDEPPPGGPGGPGGHGGIGGPGNPKPPRPGNGWDGPPPDGPGGPKPSGPGSGWHEPPPDGPAGPGGPKSRGPDDDFDEPPPDGPGGPGDPGGPPTQRNRPANPGQTPKPARQVSP